MSKKKRRAYKYTDEQLSELKTRFASGESDEELTSWLMTFHAHYRDRNHARKILQTWRSHHGMIRDQVLSDKMRMIKRRAPVKSKAPKKETQHCITISGGNIAPVKFYADANAVRSVIGLLVGV